VTKAKTGSLQIDVGAHTVFLSCRNEVFEELPEVEGGSKEVFRVRETLDHLFKLIRFGNTAFYSGDLRKAYTTLEEARALFIKLENNKALGIANNNLGNIMLTLYRIIHKTGVPQLCGLTKQQIIEMGSEYFDKAIDLGEEALSRINREEGFSANYLIFMQQLSNRYFNRGLFLLTVREDHSMPNEVEQQGWLDLSTCKDMDREVVDNADHEGFKGERDIYFEVLLARIKGLLSLMKLDYTDQWGIEDLFQEAKEELANALRVPGHTLFTDLDLAGQMQRLDEVMIDFYLHCREADGEGPVVGARNPRKANRSMRSSMVVASRSRVEKAAMIGIRMLIEDDYVIADASLLALKALVESLHESGHHGGRCNDLAGLDPSDVQSTLFHYRQHIAEALSLSNPPGDLVSQETFRMSNMGDFSMEFF